MQAHEKLHSFGEKRVAEMTGRSLSIVYRWRKALQKGERISEPAMRLLIRATEESEFALRWADFEPSNSQRIAA